MKSQFTNFNCGPAAVQNALLVLGYGSNQRTLARLCRTTTEGTNEEGILECLQFMGLTTDVCSTTDTKEARDWLRLQVCKNPVIACIDSWNHWVVVAGDCGGRICMLDSDFSDGVNRRQHGSRWLTYPGFLRKWRASRQVSKVDRYYAIGVKKGK